MTHLRMSPAEARRLGLLGDSVESPEPRKKRRATTYSSPPPSVDSSAGVHPPVASDEEVVGLFGGTLHRWVYTKRVDGWLSVCGRIQRNNEPPKGEGVRCEACYQEEVTA